MPSPRVNALPDLIVGRRPLLGAGVAAAAAGLLAGCGDDEAQTTAAGSSSSSTSSTSSSSSSSDASGGAALVKLADVPVGGAVAAKSADGKDVIVAQPTAGEVVGFSAICTHMKCPVKPTGAKLVCPCHGSTYDAMTGKNLSGPAPSPLASFAVAVKGDDVVAG